ncbi:SGS domain-containing protein [Filobasidium floriforme]|uniref:SGS domain-containing protein n=1 Tax=Filobasidium floriforme TaxID=5210 RepID=UPI001E8D3C3E|nr:SGS domain-containing protein [Filobasidium floriforme]KAH8089464.1 SGS domain-containing protein [Filobasidium floriforme]
MSTRHDYYQTDTLVYISIYRKKVAEDELKVESLAHSLKVSVGDETLLDLQPLWADINPASTATKVFGTKVEIKLEKSNPGPSWPNLTRSAQDQDQDQPLASTSTYIQPPTASTSTTSNPANLTSTSASSAPTGPRRNKFDTLDLDADLEEDQDQAGKGTSEKDLEKFFQTLYGDLPPEGRRAMMKSFTESGGTVLSTDWGDVGGRKVEAQPPK